MGGGKVHMGGGGSKVYTGGYRHILGTRNALGKRSVIFWGA